MLASGLRALLSNRAEVIKLRKKMSNKMTNRRRVAQLRVMVGALMGLLASVQFTAAQAEEANASTNPEPASTSAAPSQKDAEKSQQPAIKTAKAPDEFSPSEEISEDFAVSFPVDI